MKKIIALIMCIMFAVAFCSCSSAGIQQTSGRKNSLPEGSYRLMDAAWNMYEDAEELTSVADLVFIEKVTDIEFQVLNSVDSLPVTEKTPESNRWLYTIYTVEVLETYKGDTKTVSKIRVMGGMVGYNVEEQIEVMEKESAYGKEYGIPVWNGYEKVKCDIGKSYLFALCQFETGFPTILNLEQSVFSLNEPYKNKDTYGNDIISVNDVISEFGAEKVSAFESKWSKGEYSVN